MAKKNIIKKTTKKLNKTAKKINKWERKNPGTVLTAKIGTAVVGGIATKIIVKNEVKKQLEAAKAGQNPTPAPEKKKGLSALPIVGKFFDKKTTKKEETTPATPTEAEVAA
jgi:hypothetical protein